MAAAAVNLSTVSVNGADAANPDNKQPDNGLGLEPIVPDRPAGGSGNGGDNKNPEEIYKTVSPKPKSADGPDDNSGSRQYVLDSLSSLERKDSTHPYSPSVSSGSSASSGQVDIARVSRRS